MYTVYIRRRNIRYDCALSIVAANIETLEYAKAIAAINTNKYYSAIIWDQENGKWL